MIAGIVVALPQELRSLTRRRMEVGQISSLSKNCLVCLSGMGQNAAMEASKALLAEGAQFLISWGSAAALDPRLRAGTLLLPENVIAENRRFPTSNVVGRVLRSCPDPPVSFVGGDLLGSGRLLSTPRQKERLFRQTGALAADMESAAVAEAADRYSVSFAVVRAISDTADMALPAAIAEATDEGGRLQIAILLWKLLRSPGDWADVWRLSRSFGKAGRTLRRAADILFPEGSVGFEDS